MNVFYTYVQFCVCTNAYEKKTFIYIFYFVDILYNYFRKYICLFHFPFSTQIKFLIDNSSIKKLT